MERGKPPAELPGERLRGSPEAAIAGFLRWRGVASALVEVECLRTLDRLRLVEPFDEMEVALRREAVFRLLDTMEVVELDRPARTSGLRIVGL